MDLSKEALGHLVESSYTFVRVDSQLVSKANTAFENLMKELVVLNEDFSFIREGEEEFDLGLICRDGAEGKDNKYFFHWAHDIFIDLSPKKVFLQETFGAELEIINKLYWHINEISLEVGQLLQDSFYDLFGRNLVEEMKKCTAVSVPYSTNTLRSLWYPPIEGQKGASSHNDRSFLTVHLHSGSGKLVGYKPSGTAFWLEAPYGYAPIFFGAKAEILSKGLVKALRHGSMVTNGNDRRALVQFVHTEVGQEIRSADGALIDNT